LISYLASRLVNLILPGHAPRIVPVTGADQLMIGSYVYDDFEAVFPFKKVSFILLNLALDLMDIGDRLEANWGIATINGQRDAVFVDLDRSHLIKRDWLSETRKELFNRDHPVSKSYLDQYKAALAQIASFSDAQISEAFFAGINELEMTMGLTNIETHFPINFIYDEMMMRKHQMDWLSRHFEDL
jgi:hypothetical protein